MSYGQQKPWSGMYMQHSTYSHDFSQLGISPRQRPGDNVYNASVRADIPAGTYRPTMYDQMESPRREEAQQRYDYRGDLTERRIPKRGTEWIGGRRYDNEPREGRNDMYERQRRIDLSPERMFNREFEIGIPYKERPLETLPYATNIRRRQTFTQGDAPRFNQNFNRKPKDAFDPYNYGRHTSIGQQIQSNSPRNLDPYSFGRHTSVGQYDRGRNGSPERIDRGRNGSPERERKFEQVREPNDRHNRYIDKDKNRHIYPAWYDYPREPVRDKYDERYEKPRDQIMDGYANHKMSDRTTQKDYGEFMLEKIKQDEIRRNLDYPRQEAPAAQSGGVYLFIRTDKGALTEIRKALQEGRSVLANSGGQLKGIAHSEQIKLLEGQHGWNVRYPVTRRGEYWMERTDSNPTLNNIIIVLEFSDVQHADLWLMTSKFKSMQFPEPYGFESFIVPINYNPTYGGFTFLLTEYPEAFTDLIRDKYLPRLRSLLGRFYRYDDQMTIQFLSSGFPRDESRASRGNWINRRSSIVGVRFRNEYDALDFWRDTEFRSIREEIKQLVERDPYQPADKWFHPITVVFTLNELRV